LQLTGRDKVIIMAHSIGGLGSRQYLQNPGLWQPDGKHHVAKLITAGTPHAGSNTSISEFANWIIGCDDRSEGIRDARASYSQTGDSGVFLFGGWESNTVIDDMIFSDYYNVDVNCNGYEGDVVTGINQKSMPRDLDFALIIGECNGCMEATPGDGLVLSASADLNNLYPNLTGNIFYYDAFNLIQIHGDLNHIMFLCMQGMDEPNDYPYSYHIGFDTTYMAFTTKQPLSGYSYDYDDYKFSVPATSAVTVSISNIALSNLMVRIVDLVNSSVVHSSLGASSINYTQTLNPGDYYLEIYGTPTSTSYLYPYNFKITKTVISSIDDISKKPDNILIYPNPATSILNIEGFTCKTSVKLFDMLGNLVIETETDGDKTLDVSQLPQGVYTFVAENKDSKMFSKVIISK
jgi:hypothetical protein